ncbi:Invasion associated protein p60 [hydrothermal vent metagenome]|uniref:Invasion associated protein p60 n=1 Tax=hydrothermal vent metagenome TaxID=652676 RepID=A0A1W1BIM1_9ZZZZ
MKKLYTLLLTLSLAAVTTHAAAKTVKHTIKNGETLYTIAHKNHTTIEEVRKLNGLKKGETLKLGRVLKVSQNTYFPDKKKNIVKVTKKSQKVKVAQKNKQKTIRIKKSAKIAKYTIKNGDTLFTIAHKHHTTIAEVKKANGLKRGERLKLGRVLKIPKNTYFPNKKKKVTAEITKKKLKIAAVSKNKKKFLKAKKSVKKSVKNKRSNRILRTAINRHAISMPSKRIKRRLRTKYTMDDIFFKAAQPNIGFSKMNAKPTKITKLAKKKLGKRYVWGATGSNNTFDCSGLTTYVYKKNGINLPRRAIAQSKVGKRIARSQLRPGDLIFFDTSKGHRGYVNHVGIYIGNGKFIHASSAKKKVIITSLSKPFYSHRFKVARRFASAS